MSRFPTDEDRQVAEGCVRMRGQDAWSLACMRSRGEDDRAQAILEDMNAARRRIGAAEFAMPEPIRPAGYYNAMSHGRTPERADLDPKPIGDGRFQVAA